MRTTLVSIDDAIETVKKYDRMLGDQHKMSAEVTELLFVLRHMKKGLNLFGADTNEALFIASNFKGTADYAEKRKKQLQLEQKYAMRRHFPEDRYDNVTLDDSALDKEEGFWNA